MALRDIFSRRFYEKHLTQEQADEIMRHKNRNTRHLKFLIFTQKKCKFCGSTDNPTVDHIIPVSITGRKRKYDLSNKQLLCRDCNRKKGSKIVIHS